MNIETVATQISSIAPTMPLDTDPKSMEAFFYYVPQDVLDLFVPVAVRDLMRSFHVTIPEDWPRDVAISVKVTAHPSSFNEPVDADELQHVEADSGAEESQEPTDFELETVTLATLCKEWLDTVMEDFVLRALPLYRQIEEGDAPELSDDEIDAQYLQWLADQSEIRVKIRRRPGLSPNAFTTIDRKRSPLEPYELSLEVLPCKRGLNGGLDEQFVQIETEGGIA